MKRNQLCLTVSFLVLLLACVPFGTPSPTSTPMPTNTFTPEPTAGSISGKVIDSADGSPVSSANISTNPPTSAVTADERGSYSISEVPPGVYTVTAVKASYTGASVQVAVVAGKTTTADLHLASSPADTPPSRPSLASGLVAYYPFNGNAEDESGNGNSGTVYGATLTADRFGNEESAYSFDGVNDYISMASSVSGHAEFAQSLWVWIGPDAPEGRRDLIQTANGGIHYGWPTASSLLIDIYANRGGGVRGPGSATRYYYDFTVDDLDRGWNHLVFVAYSNDTARFFVNGSEISIGTRTTDRGVTGDYEATIVGATRDSRQGTTYHYFAGFIDDVRLYNRVLTESEILMLYGEDGQANENSGPHNQCCATWHNQRLAPGRATRAQIGDLTRLQRAF